MDGASLLMHHGYWVNWACSTSPPPPGTLANGVGELIELQVYSGAAWEVGEALSLGDVVLHFLQVGQQWRLLRPSAGELGLLHGDADRALLQRLVGHVERLERREEREVLMFYRFTPFFKFKRTRL